MSVANRVNGKAFTKALRDDHGRQIKSKREAEKARAKIMAAFHSLRHSFVSLCREAGEPLSSQFWRTDR